MFKKGDRVLVKNCWGPKEKPKFHILETIYEITDTSPTPFMRLMPLPVGLQLTDEGRKYARCCQHGGRDVHFSRLMFYPGDEFFTAETPMGQLSVFG